MPKQLATPRRCRWADHTNETCDLDEGAPVAVVFHSQPLQLCRCKHEIYSTSVHAYCWTRCLVSGILHWPGHCWYPSGLWNVRVQWGRRGRRCPRPSPRAWQHRHASSRAPLPSTPPWSFWRDRALLFRGIEGPSTACLARSKAVQTHGLAVALAGWRPARLVCCTTEVVAESEM